MSTPPSSAPSALTRTVTADLLALLGGQVDAAALARSLRLLAKWRSEVIANTLVVREGAVVRKGPFAGMAYGGQSSEGARAARLLGAYEAALHPVIETIVARGYAQVVDVGCAEGYYAVGLARRMPAATVHARDTNPAAQAACRSMAQANGVAAQVQVGGEWTHADFDLCHAAPTVVICDIEGGEADLLDPARAPGLAAADILVEVHEGMKPGLVAALTGRFAATHRITRLDRRTDEGFLPPWADDLSDLDRLLFLWEWRSSPTPWLWMDRR